MHIHLTHREDLMRNWMCSFRLFALRKNSLQAFHLLTMLSEAKA
jgi:hypothetical protein